MKRANRRGRLVCPVCRSMTAFTAPEKMTAAHIMRHMAQQTRENAVKSHALIVARRKKFEETHAKIIKATTAKRKARQESRQRQ